MREENVERGIAVERDELASVAAQFARDLLVLIDNNGTVLWVSPTCRDLLGVDAEAMLGRRFDEFVHPDDRDKRIAERTTDTTELRLLRGDGSVVDVETIAVPIMSKGLVGRVVITARDITSRKAFERRMRGVVDQLPASVWMTDRDLNVTSSAGGGWGSIGVRPDEIVGMSLHDFLEGDEIRDDVIENHRRVLRGEHLAYERHWR